ncbi:hypothetical protein RR46_03290 [Papilio xuthus]|uniref:Uncharacterized protein n=1 Tax=Papilio xuthus TaxID=66420 RepID=A0A194QGY3_PAPXU|nr:hypothetical protein RR46_03290 [Papilio xuthus]
MWQALLLRRRLRQKAPSTFAEDPPEHVGSPTARDPCNAGGEPRFAARGSLSQRGALSGATMCARQRRRPDLLRRVGGGSTLCLPAPAPPLPPFQRWSRWRPIRNWCPSAPLRPSC